MKTQKFTLEIPEVIENRKSILDEIKGDTDIRAEYQDKARQTISLVRAKRQEIAKTLINEIKEKFSNELGFICTQTSDDRYLTCISIKTKQKNRHHGEIEFRLYTDRLKDKYDNEITSLESLNIYYGFSSYTYGYENQKNFTNLEDFLKLKENIEYMKKMYQKQML